MCPTCDYVSPPITCVPPSVMHVHLVTSVHECDICAPRVTDVHPCIQSVQPQAAQRDRVCSDKSNVTARHTWRDQGHVGPWAAVHEALPREQSQVQPCPSRTETRTEQSSGRCGVVHEETHICPCQCRDPLWRDTQEPGTAPACGKGNWAAGLRGWGEAAFPPPASRRYWKARSA